MSATVHRIKIENETLRKVTVVEDRAELKREFVVKLASGINEVIIENVSANINDDSVRVAGRGTAVIEEVQVTKRRVIEGAGDSDRAKELRTEKEQLSKRKQIIDIEKNSLSTRIDILDKLIGEISLGISGTKDAKFSTDQETFASVVAHFDFYDKQITELRCKLCTKEEEMAKAQEQLIVAAQQLSQVEGGTYMKIISITLDSAEGGEVELELTYQVSGAKWSPLYDIRVDTREGKTGMQLSYFATVCQRTGEDWEGAQLTLSTARPCLGASIPLLGTLDVSFYREPVYYQQESDYAAGGTHVRALSAMPNSQSARASNRLQSFAARPAPPPMQPRVAEVSAHALSTEFAITRPCCIPSDGSGHKVTIGIIPLEPKLVHESVPSKNASAFLTATAVNSSALPLLAGQASIYLDGAFVAKTQIKAVSPFESFSSSLGVDAAVKIEYKPAHRYHERSGLINKQSSTMIEQKIIVKNTRGDGVLLTVREPIPRSTDEKIVVKVISPKELEKVAEEQSLEVEHVPKVGARLLPSNNLEWTVRLEKGESQTLLVKYSIEHPSRESGRDTRLAFAERFGQ